MTWWYIRIILHFVDWHPRRVQPGVPVNLLHSLQIGELLQEERLELIRVDGLVGKVVVVRLEERFKDFCSSNKVFKVPQESRALLIGHILEGKRDGKELC